MMLVGRADNNVTLRVSLIRHGKARSCRHSHSMSNDLNTAVAYERGSLRASLQALSTALHSLELAMASPALARLVDRACKLAERYIIIRATH